MGQELSRAGAVTHELAARGLESALAQAVSDDLLARHPLARRLGVRRLSRELRELGLPIDGAREAAALVHALETLELGGDYGAALEELREAGLCESVVQQAGLDAARIHRACPRGVGSRSHDGLLPASGVTLILATAMVVASAVIANWISVHPG